MAKKFIFSCCVLLTLTGLAKLYSATGNAEILDLADPLLGVSNGTVFLTAGALELSVAAYLLLGENNIRRCACIFWLALNFFLYRVGIYWLNLGKACPCVGTLGEKLERLGLKPEMTNWLLKMVIVYMLTGGVFFLIAELRRQREKLPI
jgi:hypothetical protein